MNTEMRFLWGRGILKDRGVFFDKTLGQAQKEAPVRRREETAEQLDSQYTIFFLVRSMTQKQRQYIFLN